MTEPLVIAEGVSRAHRAPWGELRVLDGVSLEVRAGELVLLVGPSGSGKTTLVSVLAGLMRADAGRIVLAGERIDGAGERAIARVRRRAVGFVYQSFQLFDALSARDNVAEVLALRGMRIAGARAEATRLLDAVGLGDRADHLPSQLSAGQKQRVAIARAFAGEPRVIFGDEPTAALDAHTATEIMRVLRARLGAQRCAIVVTHDLRLRAHADRVLRLEGGRLEELA